MTSSDTPLRLPLLAAHLYYRALRIVPGLIRSWIADLVLGIRLAVGDRNTPWGRLALMTVGVGIGVLVLLASAALPNWAEAKDQRAAARDAVWAHPDLLPTAENLEDPDSFVRGSPELDISDLEDDQGGPDSA